MSNFFGVLNMVLIMTVCSCETANKPEKPIEIKTKPKIEEVKKEVTELEYYAELVSKYRFENYQSQHCEVAKTGKPKLSTLKNLPKEILQGIEKDYKVNNPDFNCRYKIVTWFCGSPCQQNAIFDNNTGELVEIIESAGGIEYRISSRLLIVNPAEDAQIDTVNFRSVIGPPVYWEMTLGKLHKIEWTTAFGLKSFLNQNRKKWQN